MNEPIVDAYLKLNKNSKREKLLYEIKVIIAVLQKICDDRGIVYSQIHSREILDLNSDDVSEEDYLEALFVYVTFLKELVGCYFDEMESMNRE